MDALVARLTLWSVCFLLAALVWFALGAVATWVLHLGDPPILVDVAAAAALSLVLYTVVDRRRRA